MYEGYEIETRGGLVALEYSEQDWENPLTWWSIKERGKCEMASVPGVRSGDPGEVTCSRCEGNGTLEATDGEEPECPDCEGYGVRPAKSEAEWCADHGAVAAVPVSYNMNTSQPWIQTVDWENLEDAGSILYLEEGYGHTTEVIEARITDLSFALEYGYSIVTVGVDPDSDLPEDALDGWTGGGVGMILGQTSIKEEADRQLEDATAYLRAEMARREALEARGVKAGGSPEARRVTLDRADLLEVARHLVADLESSDPYWTRWDEEEDGADSERAALVRAVESIRTALEEGGSLRVPSGPALEVPPLEEVTN